MLSNDCSVKLIYHYFYFIFDYFWFLRLRFNRYNLLLFPWFIIIKLLLFGVLVIIFALLIVDLFVCIYWIRINLSWNLSSGVIECFLWTISKPDIHHWSPFRFVEGRGEGAGWVFRLVHFNWLIDLI